MRWLPVRQANAQLDSRCTMNTRFLGTFAWVLWSVLLVVLLYGLVLLLQDGHGRSSPEASSALGFMASQR